MRRSGSNECGLSLMSSERDTDSDWNQLGKVDPYWAVITDERYRADTMDALGRQAFYDSGLFDVDMFHATLKRHFSAPDHFETCLDFGAGVGRLLVPMAQRANRAVGIDIAESMRAICQTHLDELGLAQVKLVPTPQAAAEFGPFDWINSYIVMQHIPPSRGLELIESLTSLLEPGGYLSLHISTHRDPHLMPSQTRNPLRLLARSLRNRLFPQRDVGQITMYDYDLADVLSRLERLGCKQFHLEPTNHGGHHGFMIYTQRTQ